MNLLERVLTLLRINIDAFLEKAPDPQSSLRQLQLDMRNQLVQVKTQVATAIASAHQLQRRAREKQEEAAAWLKKAEQALRQGNEEAARSALLQYNEFNRLALRYEQQRQAQEQLAHTMRDALQQLEARLRELEMASELLEMKQRQERIQQRILNEQQRLQSDDRKRRERFQVHLASERQGRQQHPQTKGEQQRPESGDRSPTTEALSSSLPALQQASPSPRVHAGLADLEQQLRALKTREQSQGLPLMQVKGAETPEASAKSEEERGEKEKTPSGSGRTRPGARRTTGRATTRTTDALDRTTLTDLPLLLETLQAHHRHTDEPPE